MICFEIKINKIEKNISFLVMDSFETVETENKQIKIQDFFEEDSDWFFLGADSINLLSEKQPILGLSSFRCSYFPYPYFLLLFHCPTYISLKFYLNCPMSFLFRSFINYFIFQIVTFKAPSPWKKLSFQSPMYSNDSSFSTPHPVWTPFSNYPSQQPALPQP